MILLTCLLAKSALSNLTAYGLVLDNCIATEDAIFQAKSTQLNGNMGSLFETVLVVDDFANQQALIDSPDFKKKFETIEQEVRCT